MKIKTTANLVLPQHIFFSFLFLYLVKKCCCNTPNVGGNCKATLNNWQKSQQKTKIKTENIIFEILKINAMTNNKVTLHRVFSASPEKVFRAFTDADAMASWIPPYGFICKVHSMDVKIGGTYKMSFTNFTTGSSHSFGGEYLEIIPNELLKYTDKFDDPNLQGQMITKIELRKVICGTELFATQEGIPDVIPTEMCYLGWQESLDKLKRLVEPNIPDA